MTLCAVCFDLGGVILRTEDRIPRMTLAKRLGTTYEKLERLVFAGKSSQRASIGLISAEDHWHNIAREFNLPASEADRLPQEFFGGDHIDHALLDFIRSLRPQYKTGLISNAWLDLRPWIVSQHFDDAFDQMVISAEAGLLKPDARIYHIALERLGIAPAEAVFLDDTLENVEGARLTGMLGIHFTQRERALEELGSLLNSSA